MIVQCVFFGIVGFIIFTVLSVYIQAARKKRLRFWTDSSSEMMIELLAYSKHGAERLPHVERICDEETLQCRFESKMASLNDTADQLGKYYQAMSEQRNVGFALRLSELKKAAEELGELRRAWMDLIDTMKKMETAASVCRDLLPQVEQKLEEASLLHGVSQKIQRDLQYGQLVYEETLYCGCLPEKTDWIDLRATIEGFLETLKDIIDIVHATEEREGLAIES